MTETLYSGLAVGGPMDGREVEGRYPGGILFVNKPTSQAWLYDFYADQGKFYLRPVDFDEDWDEMTDDEKMQVYEHLAEVSATRELDYEKRLAAADSANTEVRALPEEVGV
jgi:hypothetical protein